MKTKATSTIVSFQYDGEEEYQKKYSKDEAEEMIRDNLDWRARDEFHTVKIISGTLTE